jgi:hypothetical protein
MIDQIVSDAASYVGTCQATGDGRAGTRQSAQESAGAIRGTTSPSFARRESRRQ